MSKSNKTTAVYQVKITLKNSSPKIWRRILVADDFPLRDFHKVIQTVMGWQNCHLHQFVKGNVIFSPEDHENDFFFGFNSRVYVNYKKQRIRLNDLFTEIKDKVEYEYDFGDSWKHILLLEKILPPKKGIRLPICIAGKMACPPEDIGGIYGYYRALEILADEEDDEHEEMKDWLEEFNPEHFDIDEVNFLLQGKDYGSPEF